MLTGQERYLDNLLSVKGIMLTYWVSPKACHPAPPYLATNDLVQ